MNNLADTLMHMRLYAEAEQLFSQTREIQRRVLGPEHPETAGSTYNLACVAAKRGQHDRAVSLLYDALDHGLSLDAVLHMEMDPDLKPLAGEPPFQVLLARARQRALTLESK